MTRPTLTQHPDWPRALALLSVGYDRKIVRQGLPRLRVGASPTTAADRAFLLGLTCGCATCGAEIRPFRESRQRHATGIYCAVTCGYRTGRFGCGHHARAHAEYERIRAAYEGRPQAQGSLL